MENRKIKLIWDFNGPDSEQIAKHHVTHLKEFAVIEKLDHEQVGMESENDFHSLAFWVIEPDQLSFIKNRLKPHRGFYVDG